MPKEMIYELRRGNEDPGRRIEVGWARDLHVQIATTHKISDAEPTYMSKDMVPETPETWDGQHVQLERYQINALIHALRRARDQVFGKDA